VGIRAKGSFFWRHDRIRNVRSWRRFWRVAPYGHFEIAHAAGAVVNVGYISGWLGAILVIVRFFEGASINGPLGLVQSRSG